MHDSARKDKIINLSNILVSPTNFDTVQDGLKEPVSNIQFEEFSHLQTTIESLLNKISQLENEKKELLSFTMHDLKNPLSIITMIGKILLSENKLNQDEIKEFGKDIVQSSERMFQIIQHFTNLYSLEQGYINIDYQHFPASSIFDTVIEENLGDASTKNIEIQPLYTNKEKCFCIADFNLALQIFDSIFSNAIIFSPIGSRIQCSIEVYENMVCFKITDNGPGISELDQTKLFTKFTKLSAKPTGNEHTSGLGLYIAKQLAESMNGSIECESDIGVGSTFTLKLPKSTEHYQ